MTGEISILKCYHSQRSVISNLQKLFGGLIVGSLIGYAILEFGFADLESYAIAILMAVSSKKKKKGFIATLGQKTVRRVQSSFWQAFDTKPEAINSTRLSKNIDERHSLSTTFENDEDSFETSMTNVNASLPSNSSGSYVTACCESDGADEVFRCISPAVSVPKNVGENSTEQENFDVDSGKGVLSPPPQHVEISDSEIHDETTASTVISQISRRSPSVLLNKENRDVRTILDELQSKAVSDDVKAKNLASLNQIILQCKDYMQRYSLRQDLMSLGLFKALSTLIESKNRAVESELEIFFASESNDNLIGHGPRHPIDIFQAAYVKLKHSTSAEILLDILELVAKTQPNDKKLRDVLHCLRRGRMRNEEVQTERVIVGDSCDTELSKNATGCKDVQDQLKLSEFAPVLQAIRRPRSTSRMKRSRSEQITIANIPFIDDDVPAVTSSKKLDEGNEKQNQGLRKSPKSLQLQLPIEKQGTVKPTIPSVPPPPPLPPPAPEFLNPSLAKQKPTTASSVVVKSVPTYKKNCATNTVAWETVKPEMVVTRSTIWSDQSGIYAEFNQQERERLEKVFARKHSYNPRFAVTQGRTRNISIIHKKETAINDALTEKRALNLGIVLARFRPLTLEQLVQKIESLAISDLSLDYLASLLKHFPSPEELSYFAKVDTPDNLKDAELFCFLVARKPLLKLRIELKVLVDNIVSDLARQLECTRLLLAASDELYNSPSINSFFHRCLQYGNFLNQSTFAAGASGFALSSLLPALNTKGTGVAANTRLVDILAEYADESLKAVVKLLDFLEPARKYSIDDLEKSEASLRHSLEMSLKGLLECGDNELHARYSPVLMDSAAKCGQLARSIKKVRSNENRLKDYYCAPQMSLDNIFEILSQSLKLFKDSLNKAEMRAAGVQRKTLQQQRIGAGNDTLDDRRSRHQKNYRIRTFERPNVKDLIDIINSNECR